MHFARFRQLASAFGLVAAVLGTGALAQQQPASEPRVAEPRAAADAAAERHVEVLLVEEETPTAEPKTRKIEKFDIRLAPSAEMGFWIGLQLDPAPEALRSQLRLADGQGLVVTELFPDTPAVKSGFAKHDVIVKVDDQAAADVDAFNKIVQETKGEKELAVALYRSGVPQTIKVTPAKRPADNAFTLQLGSPTVQEDVLMEWMPKGLDLEHPMRVEFYNPGLVVGRSGELKIGNLPKNLSIAISKSGDEPAKVSVSKDSEKWEVTEKELDKLPPEIRGHVERMLRPGPWEARALHVRPHVEFAPRAVITPRHPVPVAPPAVAPRPTPPAPAAGDVDRRLEEVNERLEHLQKALDALIEQRAKEANEKPQQ